MGKLQKLTKLLENFKKIQGELTEGIGQIAVTEFTLNFRRQGFNGNSWKPKKKDNGKNILINRGSLRRSIKVLRKDKHSITVGSELPYAKIHNEGGVINKKASTKILHFRNTEMDYNKKTKTHGTGTKFSRRSKAHFAQKVNIGAYKINMPKRQFIGDMPILTKKITAYIKNKLKQK